MITGTFGTESKNNNYFFMGDFLKGLVIFLLNIALAVLSIPFGIASLVVCFLLVGLVIGVGLPIAIALGVLGLPVYALYEFKEYLNEM
jgi:hypothetical protein